MSQLYTQTSFQQRLKVTKKPTSPPPLPQSKNSQMAFFLTEKGDFPDKTCKFFRPNWGLLHSFRSNVILDVLKLSRGEIVGTTTPGTGNSCKRKRGMEQISKT